MAVAAVCLLVSIATVQAGVPLPDFVLYGPLSINGQQQTAMDNVVVIARVDGVVEPVGVYKMGQSSTAGDNYVLRIRVESGADGSKQSGNAARVGQTVQIFVKRGNDPEVRVGGADFTITRIGLVDTLDLIVQDCAPSPDSDGDGDVDLEDYAAFQGCLTGPGSPPLGPSCVRADADCDGDVDLLDFRVLQTAFGQ